MKKHLHDPGLDALLALDGERFALDSGGTCWVKFDVKSCAATPERPKGLRYSLTLHDRSGARLLGFDNAHAVQEGSGPGTRTRIEHDHQHRGHQVRFYLYETAAQLLADFWTAVEAILEKRSSQHEQSQHLEGGDRIVGAVQGPDDGHRPR
jgi:hypothetical protein